MPPTDQLRPIVVPPEETVRAERGGRTEGVAGIRRFRVTVISGGNAGCSKESVNDHFTIGSHELNDLRVSDVTASRFHCEIRVEGDHVRIRDVGSSNGTFVQGLQVADAFLTEGVVLRVGETSLRFNHVEATNTVERSKHSKFGTLVGVSPAMRTMFAMLERVAITNATVLLQAETGCGKGEAAESIHRASARRNGPFVIVDCGAIPPNLLESELFGHEKGAFTGALARRVGAFEEADGGTLFLDEIGEMPVDLQPKLLRALESRAIRRVGSNGFKPIDVRIVAATNRDLRAEVNAGRFRSDLYFRLAVVNVAIPPLRERPQDLPGLAEKILETLGASREARAAVLTPSLLSRLERSTWAGNVRELRNFLELSLIFPEASPPGEVVPSTTIRVREETLSFAVARDRAIAQFERSFVDSVLNAHGGNATRAAQACGLSREYFHRLIRRHRRSDKV